MGGWQQSVLSVLSLLATIFLPVSQDGVFVGTFILSTNNFWAILAPEECCSTLEKVSFMSERALLRRSLLHDLRPVPRLLRRNPCCSPASEIRALKAGSGSLTMEIF